MAKIQDGFSPDPWKGEYWGKIGAVNYARYDYQVERHFKTAAEKSRLKYVSTLYSALTSVYPKARRLNLLAGIRAFSCLVRLWPFMEEYARVTREDSKRFLALSNDGKEMLGAVLFRFAAMTPINSDEYITAAKAYAHQAFVSSRGTEEHHTRALAALTLARLSEQKDKSLDVSYYIRIADEEVVRITDLNQKARVLRGLAEIISRQPDGQVTAVKYFDQLNQMQDLSADVKVKNEEMRIKLKL